MPKFELNNSSITIKDAAKQQRFMLGFLMGINLFNAILFLSGSDKAITYWLNILWIVIGIISALGIAYLLLKRSYQATVQREEIKAISWKCTKIAKSISFNLTNGKVRVVSFTNEQSLKEQLHALKQNNFKIQ